MNRAAFQLFFCTVLTITVFTPDVSDSGASRGLPNVPPDITEPHLPNLILAEQSAYAPRCDVAVEDGQFGHIELCASTVLPGQAGNSYVPLNMLDDDPATAWVEAAPNDGTGQWIEYVFEWPMRLQTFEIQAGYAKNASVHQNNARPHEVAIFADDKFVETIALRDDMTLQTVRLSAPVEAQFFRLEFLSAYPGRKWQDLAVSEFYVDIEEYNYQLD